MMHTRKHLYPPNWKQLARECKEKAGWRCERCHIKHGSRRRKSKRTGLPYPTWLHAAHKRLSDTLNPDPELLCLCPCCHGAYDYRQRLREGIVQLEQLKHQIVLHRQRSREHVA